MSAGIAVIGLVIMSKIMSGSGQTIVLLLSFVLMVWGVNQDSGVLYGGGFIIATLAMLYSPFKVQLPDKVKKQKNH